MYENEKNNISFDSSGKVAEFNADNRSIYDVYGHDNYTYKKDGEKWKHVWNNKNPTGTHLPDQLT